MFSTTVLHLLLVLFGDILHVIIEYRKEKAAKETQNHSTVGYTLYISKVQIHNVIIFNSPSPG